jgi:hypothetical protein
MARVLVPVAAFLLILGVSPAQADSGGMDMKGGGAASAAGEGAGSMGNMKMPMSEGPATFKPETQAYTTNRAFLVKVVTLPDPIPYEKHFAMTFSVYDGRHPERRLPGAEVHVTAGMRHGQKTGFAHGMQSTPKVERKGGVDTVSGLYFHMLGRWTLQVDVQNGDERGTAYLDLPCCAQ